MGRAPIAVTGWVLLAMLAVVPFVTLLGEMLFPGGALSFAALGTVLDEQREWELFANTLGLGVGSAAGALLLGVTCACVVARSQSSLAKLVRSLLVVPLLIPPLVHAIAWTTASELRGPVAMVVVLSLSYFPMVAVLTAASLDAIDRRHEEAALLAGGERARVRLALRLAAPSALSGAVAVFVFAVSDFAVPDYLSTVGTKVNVYANEIFTRWQREGDSGGAIAAALPPAALAAIAIAGLSAFRRRGGAVTITGSGFQPPLPLALGGWRVVAIGGVILTVLLSCVVPIACLLYTAGSFTVLQEALSQARGEVLRSIGCAATAAVFSTAVAFVVCWSTIRRGVVGERAAEVIALLPMALPAIALGVGLIRTWNRPAPASWVYDGPAIVVAAFSARFLVFAHTSANAGLVAQSPDLEDAARIAGISPWRRMWSIAAPVAAPSIASAALLVFLFSMRELDAIVLIPQGNRSVLFRIYNAIHFNRPQFVAALSLVLVFLTAAPWLLWRVALGRRMEVPR